MENEGGFALVLVSARAQKAALGTLSATLTFTTNVADQAEWELLQEAIKVRTRFYVYGSFEDEVASVLRTDRDKWKKTAVEQRQRIDQLERMLAEARSAAP